MTYEYRALSAGEEPEFFGIIHQALGAEEFPWEPFVERIGRDNLRGVTTDGRLIGGLGVYRTGQWFGGNVVPCGGVAAVGIAPESRGQGAAKFAVASLLEELHADGTPIACLYPSTQRLYRSVGFEEAGSYCRHKLPLSLIEMTDRELPVTHVDDPSPQQFATVADRRARMTNGNLQRTEGLWRRILRYRDKPTHCYLIGEPDDPQGFVCYQQERGDDMCLNVSDMAAVTPAAARRLWTLLADHRSILDSVRWTGPPTEPLLVLTQECHWIKTKSIRWMLRIVNVPAALEAHGYPPHAAGEVHFEIMDDLLCANTGRFILNVANGRGNVTPGGRGEVRVDIRGLASLYSSFLSAHALRSIGRLKGDDGAITMADHLFAGPPPWIPEIF